MSKNELVESNVLFILKVEACLCQRSYPTQQTGFRFLITTNNHLYLLTKQYRALARKMSKTDVQNTFQFPRPASPSKPNAHPYAIVTSSSSLLSRSSSSSTSTSTRSHYVPPSPKSPSQARTASHSRPSGHRHHYSNSKNAAESPRPLPVPPSASPSPTKELKSPEFPRRSTGKRADSFPNAPPKVISLQPSIDDLPENPKLWTPSQLSIYLASALRVKSGEMLVLPPPVVNDIALFIRDKRISGRSFLRLTDHELQQ